MGIIKNHSMKQTTTIRNDEPNSSISEHDDDGSLYKSCINCGQNQYPFKHGICRICGDNNWIISFEKLGREKPYNQAEAELYD